MLKKPLVIRNKLGDNIIHDIWRLFDAKKEKEERKKKKQNEKNN